MALGEPLCALNIVSGCHGKERSLSPWRQTDGHTEHALRLRFQHSGEVLDQGGEQGISG